MYITHYGRKNITWTELLVVNIRIIRNSGGDSVQTEILRNPSGLHRGKHQKTIGIPGRGTPPQHLQHKVW